MDSTLVDKLPLIPMIVILVAIHEFAHAWVADRLGDDTPREEGRVTLNPMAHIDWIGTVAIPAYMILFAPGFSLLGWGRPVSTNPQNFQHPGRDTALVAFAGPAANLLLAYLALLLVHIIPRDFQSLAGMFATVSASLAIFNLLPIPPLDGWKIARYWFLLSEDIAFWGGGWFWSVVLVILLNWPPFLRVVAALTSPVLYLLVRAAGLG
jgi:Zn-dependent protease